MRKVIFYVLFIVFISTSCSSDSSGDSNFNQSNLVGTWDIKSIKDYSFANDSLNHSETFSEGEIYVIFNDNGTLISGGSLVEPDGDTINYELSTWNGKNLIIEKFDNNPNDGDTLEVLFFELPDMTVSSKIDKNSAQSGGSPKNIYNIIDLKKR